MATDITGTEDGGIITVKEGDTDVKYVKESSLLEITQSRDDLQKQVNSADTNKSDAVKAAETKTGEANTATLQAEASGERLTEEITKHTGTADELTKLKTNLETATRAGVEQGEKLLGMRREFVIATYKVPKETVESKDLVQLEVFEEALKAVMGSGAGNYAFGGAGGGANPLDGKSPMELAQLAYAK